MRQPLALLTNRLGYEFNDDSLLEQALTHRSVGAHNNERLEFVGDAILSYIISELLFERFPKAKEGELTRLRSSLVKGDTLAEIANEFSIGDYLHLGTGEMRSGGHRRASIQADAVEAIIAAIYLDSDIARVKKIVQSWFASRIDKINYQQVEKDPKTRLQEYLQAQHLPLPEYRVTHIEGEAHCQTFTVECVLQGIAQPCTGVASSRRKAEQIAADECLKRITQ